MSNQVNTLRQLGQGQKVQLTIEGGDVLPVRVTQMEYVPETKLRVEFTPDASSDAGRYQADATLEDGEWTPLTVQQYEQTDRAWTRVGEVVEVNPLEMFGTVRSSDMDAQRATGDQSTYPDQ